MPRPLAEIRDEALRILRDEYPPVAEGILTLEVFMRMRSKKAVYELRDFLNHLALIFNDHISAEKAEAHLAELRTHLRRCAVEPLEYQAEKTLVRLDSRARWFGRFGRLLLGRNNPFREPGFSNRMRQIRQLVVDGRAIKSQGQACEKMKEAYALGNQLWDDVRPLQYVLRVILWAIGLLLAGYLMSLGQQFLTGTKGKDGTAPRAVTTPAARATSNSATSGR